MKKNLEVLKVGRISDCPKLHKITKQIEDNTKN